MFVKYATKLSLEVVL
ncbi:UNVERIFIED_CONTAM: hypothetical protein NCL1_63405 [Trichonephila clavipes]